MDHLDLAVYVLEARKERWAALEDQASASFVPFEDVSKGQSQLVKVSLSLRFLAD